MAEPSSSFGFESLEMRQMLSVAYPQPAVLAEAAAPAVRVAQAAVKRTGTFVGSATFDKWSGKLIVKVSSSQSARVYSSDFGGFDVKLTGKIYPDGRFSFSGKSTTFVVQRFSGSYVPTAKRMIGELRAVQMGLPGSSNVTLTRATTAVPDRPKVSAPDVEGRWSDGDLWAEVTRQEGGLIWAKTSEGGSVKGVVLKDGRFSFAGSMSSAKLEIWGVVRGDRAQGGWKSTRGNAYSSESREGSFDVTRD